jgi:hypothetical protein
MIGITRAAGHDDRGTLEPLELERAGFDHPADGGDDTPAESLTGGADATGGHDGDPRNRTKPMAFTDRPECRRELTPRSKKSQPARISGRLRSADMSREA